MHPPERIEALFHTALEHDAAARAAFLSEACGSDDALRAEVEALLAAHGAASGFLEHPAWELLARPATGVRQSVTGSEVEPGLPFERLGEYRLLRRLGEGGMGVVYLAVQESLGREVAIKVIRPERVGSIEAEERFWREVDAVAEVHHPNIVTVYGSGTEGRVRYFAMELVAGQGLDEILRESAHPQRRVPTDKVLGWIRDIAQALHCVHQNGILHRDVKPSNIRVTPDGRAMLMDFGVARHLELATLTMTGSFRGTPRYASPEQVRARGSVDIRTDVYSLGVTAYEAIAGRVPFEGDTTEQVFHQILDEEPLPPRRLNPAISRDLETIVLTAIDKDPVRRYQDMAAFADDIDRLLRGEVIHARPTGPVTRVWRSIRRRPALSAAIGVATGALLTLLVYGTWSYAAIAREKVQRELEVARSERINAFLARMISSPNPDRRGRNVKMVDVLEDATDEVHRFFAEHLVDEAWVHHLIGGTYVNLGLYAEAEAELRRALAIREAELGGDHADSLMTMNSLAAAVHAQDRLVEAETIYREVLERRRRTLGPESPTTLGTMNNLALVLRSQGEYQAALALLHEVVELKRRVLGREHRSTLRSTSVLATLLRRLGRYADAEREQREVLAVQRELHGDEDRSTLISMNGLGLILMEQRKYAEAERCHRQVYEIQLRKYGEEHADTLATMGNLAIDLKELGRLDEAQQLAERMLAIAEDVHGESHHLTFGAMSGLANVLKRRGLLEGAEELLADLLKRLRDVRGPGHPDTFVAMHNYGLVLKRQGKLEQALQLSRESFALARRALGETHPSTQQSLDVLGELLLLREEYSEAARVHRLGLDTAVGQHPAEHPRVAKMRLGLGASLRGLERFQEAEAELLKAYESYRSKFGDTHRMTREALELLIETCEAWGKPDLAAGYRALLGN